MDSGSLDDQECRLNTTFNNKDSFRLDFRVRYAECDAFGYLHHAKYWEYFEQARTELLRARGVRYRDLEEQGIFFVVYRCECKYLRPIRYDDLVTVSVRVTHIGHTRVDHAYEIHREGELTCQAATTLACVGCDGRPIVMPEAQLPW